MSEQPIYTVFGKADNVTGAFTGKGTSRAKYYFSFQRFGIDRQVLFQNLQAFGKEKNFEPSDITWPNGSWPHSGYAIVAEEHEWDSSSKTGGIVPTERISRRPVAYDGIATSSYGFVLGVQGADCPSLFLYDPVAKVIGLAHSGWKPTVRGVVRNTVTCMRRLGASPENIIAYLSPGVNDYYNEFQWDSDMESHIRDVFVAANREDLLYDQSIRHVMSEDEKKTVKSVTGRETRGGVSLMLSSLIRRDLEHEGIDGTHIEVSQHSTICQQAVDGTHFLYHSARRDSGKDSERPGFGSNLCVLFLHPESSYPL